MQIDRSVDRAHELSEELVDIWSQLTVPRLPEQLRSDYEFSRYFSYLEGKTWEQVDVRHRKVFSECWIELIPDKTAQVYYFGAYLKYCLEFYVEQAKKKSAYPDADLPFLCAISAARKIGHDAGDVPANVRECVVNILGFIRYHLAAFGYDIDASQQIYPQPTTAERLEEALAIWKQSSETA